MATTTVATETAPTDEAETLKKFFVSEFGCEPQAVVRAPGRVNLIGEHIDYNGYPVLPIAIKQSIFIAVSPTTDSTITIVNHSSEHAAFSCDVSQVSNIAIPPAWHDYVLCGIYGVLQELKLPQVRGMRMAVMGRVPSSAGLSSSSALVCGAAVATLTVQQPATANSAEASVGVGCSLSNESISQICAASEKYVGTQGGGMDQAACLLSKEGCAQLISFNPLKCTAVALPQGATFVVANSLQSINKAATSDFNCRVMECKLACHLLTKSVGLDWEAMPTLASLQKALNKSLDEMIELVKATLHPEPYTVKEVSKELYIADKVLVNVILSKNTSHIEQFQLRRRALHVFSEAQRVYAFKKICDDWRDRPQSQAEADPGPVLRSLGALMYSSHESARDDYECSHPALDQLVELSRQHSVGARLTGAGWGGCTVALVPASAVDAHCSALRSQYYEQLQLKEEDVQRALFASPPAAGATVTPN